MPDRTRYALTASQQEHLRTLLAHQALDIEHSISVVSMAGAHLVPGVIGILIDKGFAAKKVRGSPGGSRCTHYWLTPAGAAKARELGRVAA